MGIVWNYLVTYLRASPPVLRKISRINNRKMNSPKFSQIFGPKTAIFVEKKHCIRYVYLYNILSLSGGRRPFHPSVPLSIHPSFSSWKKKMMEEEEETTNGGSSSLLQ
jgi:hypothetical protein